MAVAIVRITVIVTVVTHPREGGSIRFGVIPVGAAMAGVALGFISAEAMTAKSGSLWD